MSQSNFQNASKLLKSYARLRPSFLRKIMNSKDKLGPIECASFQFFNFVQYIAAPSGWLTHLVPQDHRILVRAACFQRDLGQAVMTFPGSISIGVHLCAPRTQTLTDLDGCFAKEPGLML
ncbi:hypothetical protein KUV28_00005 [Ferrimonas balearica]|nr:hypothetical protein [Ferrimonas balearica]